MLEEAARSTNVARVLEEYAALGYARLGKVLDDGAMDALRRRADAIMLGEVSYPDLFFQHDTSTGRYEDLEYKKGYVGPSLRYRKMEKLERDPLFRAWIENDLFRAIALSHYGEAVSIYRAVLFTKPAFGGTLQPWHQDGGRYWGIDKEPTLQIWTALDDAPAEAGCVEIVPGSHAAGLATPLGGLIPRDVVERGRAEERKVLLPARAGEALLIHNHAWHGSGLNATDRPRRAFSICFMSAETRCVRKKRAPREFVRVFDRGCAAADVSARV